jgi:prepilin-type N-terminal cleavage/methylation domain-containing protein
MIRPLANQQKGFTLIELIIVMGIMGILATIAVPTFQNYIRNQNLKTAARGITSDFFATREKALSENVKYCIHFDQANNSYCIFTGTCTRAPCDPNPPTKFMTAYATYIKVDADQDVSFQTRGTVGCPSTSCNFTISNTMNGSVANIRVDFPSRTYATFTLQ